MKKNIGMLDRILRVLAAVVIVSLYFANVISGTIAIILLLVSGIFIITSFIGVCPLYLPFNISTKTKEK